MAIGCGTKAGIASAEPRGRRRPSRARQGHRRQDATLDPQDGGVVASYSRNTTAKLVIAQSGLGKLEDQRDHRARRTPTTTRRASTPRPTPASASIEFVPAGRRPPGARHPDAGPARSRSPASRRSRSARSRRARQRPRGDRRGQRAGQVDVDRHRHEAHGRARRRPRSLTGVKHGTFHGYSAGTRVRAAPTATITQRPHSALADAVPGHRRQGRDQDDRRRRPRAARSSSRGLAAQQNGKQRAAQERGVRARLGRPASTSAAAQLVVDGIVGQANVARKAAGKVTVSTRGSHDRRHHRERRAAALPRHRRARDPGRRQAGADVVDRATVRHLGRRPADHAARRHRRGHRPRPGQRASARTERSAGVTVCHRSPCKTRRRTSCAARR